MTVYVNSNYAQTGFYFIVACNCGNVIVYIGRGLVL